MRNPLDHSIATETFVAVVGFSTTALSIGITATTGVWTPINPMEVIYASVGGLLGAASQANARKVKDTISILASVFLAGAWSALIVPIGLHLAMMFYPDYNNIVAEMLVIGAAGAVVGAIGLEIYLLLLALVDVLRAKLPDTVDDILDIVLRKGTSRERAAARLERREQKNQDQNDGN